MYRIGDFSKASKTTIKTLRYYEKEGLLIPKFVDPYTGYRYYETSQLYDLSKIISLRKLGLSISDIKEIKSGEDLEIILQKRRKNILLEIEKSNNELNLINNLLNGGNMEKRVIIKTIPSTIVYYKEGKIKDFSEIFNFVLKAGKECKTLNVLNLNIVTLLILMVNIGRMISQLDTVKLLRKLETQMKILSLVMKKK